MSSKKKSGATNPEWSFPVDAEKITTNPLRIMIKPTPEERKALAVRFGVTSLDLLQAEMSFVREAGKTTIHATGSFEAQLKQSCVVTGAPVSSRIEEEFESWFADRQQAVPLAKIRKERMVEKGHVEMPMIPEHEDPEPVIDGKIDAGELVAQFLSLAINPYPRAEGLKEETVEVVHADKPLENPFAALKDWKNKGKSE